VSAVFLAVSRSACVIASPIVSRFTMCNFVGQGVICEVEGIVFKVRRDHLHILSFSIYSISPHPSTPIVLLSCYDCLVLLCSIVLACASPCPTQLGINLSVNNRYRIISFTSSVCHGLPPQHPCAP
jgi:hypothetical protein